MKQQDDLGGLKWVIWIIAVSVMFIAILLSGCKAMVEPEEPGPRIGNLENDNIMIPISHADGRLDEHRMNCSECHRR